ncbi:hypothetical protein JL107_07665 [Nakamurella flavida]|uniref:Signal transduction histidine kinase subgroup 3 dimerisation and phosphoacceptor domain-containing protein n=1 Tax=Nakamurella flavida TaxID=363630 RepID=A0A938YN80_9ACTN|nr:histidine kinase [Nakamurella flavida]MBM9476314.1 hypothetical protein [Nakamurella flavida]MDP9779586.1 two-component system sensor histidine kinase DesK [Nakamurella flavida]
MSLRRRWTVAREARRGPQYRAALFVIVVGVALQLVPLLEVLFSAPGREMVAFSILATVLFAYTFCSITWPMVFGGLGQRRLILRTLVYAFAVALWSLTMGPQWLDIGFLAVGLLASVLPRRWAVVAVAVLLSALTVGAVRAHVGAAALVDLLVTTVAFGAVVFALFTVSSMLHETVAGREAQAQVAVLQERLRLGRDLHDLVIHSLAAIGLKAELAERLFDRKPEAARAELGAISDLTQTSIGQVRQLVHGYRHESLCEMLDDVRLVLRSAGVSATIDAGEVPMTDDVEQAFCWVARESVTNALRHASPTFVRIALSVGPDGTARLDVVNDGVLPVPSRDGRRTSSGNGLPGLGERLATMGGSVSTLRGTDGTFVLQARVPGTNPGTSSTV